VRPQQRCASIADMTTDIRSYPAPDEEAVIALSLRAWAPVFASLEEALGSELFGRLHPDWRQDQENAVRAVLTDPAMRVWVAVEEPGPGSYATLGRPEYLRQECALSLRRLGLDHVDLYQLHQVDPAVPFEDQIGVMKELKEEGKIAAAREITGIASVQNQYSVTERKHEGALEYCTREGLPFISWFPLDIGALAQPDGPLGGVAAQAGATPAQVAKLNALGTTA
jgi:predicted aldo/keto reductase-like oxidoreductase